MSVTVLCSAPGSPGVTVSALALTLAWPRSVLLVDADRSPSQAILAGYLRGEVAPGQGLSGVLQAQRERRSIPVALESLALPLPDDGLGSSAKAGSEPARRRLLPGFLHLGSVELFAGAWAPLMQALQQLDDDVIVDAGRLMPRGLPEPVAERADRVAVVCSSTLPALVSLRLYLGALIDQVGDDRLGLLVVGPGRPYSTRELAASFGVPVYGELPWDVKGAETLKHGGVLTNRWVRRGLGRSVAELAASWSGGHEATLDQQSIEEGA